MGSTAILAARAGRQTVHGPLSLWHLLSLDAPTVAAVWTCFLAARFHVVLAPSVPIALFAAVWMMYAADRIRDAKGGTGPLEERHHFHARHEGALRWALLLAASLLLPLVIALPAHLRSAWVLLGVPLTMYGCAVHLLRLRVPKEAMVGAFFALAVPMPVLLERHTLRPVLAAALFGLLCWLNCVFIARSEDVAAGAVTAWCAKHLRLVMSMFVLLAMAAAPVLPAVSCALLLSALLLLLLLRVDRVEATHVRALADAALLTPLLVWPVLHFVR